ncbi:glutathione transferase GST 23-like [Andrographis paniculata]|uniref:glutathione transferase GST 23-like n=1 Tax=Andrographis paniculata TaxID=175694 RepID=UPI0021E9AD85|nr:glutathione transferase GST 23-like [Andrographis paniculata]
MSSLESRVRLYGFWSSSYVYRVIWALKLKGVEYEYIEEDIMNKSQALLEYNPVHKKVPVLVHCGKPVAESAVILQYIEETWPDHHNPLLPMDPYGRAVARFWIDFGHQLKDMFMALVLSSGEDKVNEVEKMLRRIQDEALGDKKFFNGDRIGLVDLCFGWIAGPWLECSQELATEEHVLDMETLPTLCRWIADFRQQRVIEENLPEREAMLAIIKRVKKRGSKLNP